MSDTLWLDVLGRIAPGEVHDLDDLLSPDAPPGRVWQGPGTMPNRPISSKLWHRDTVRSHIGVRVTEPPGDVPAIALRLASAAVERNVIPIILTTLDVTGFERFGFRVERLPPQPEDRAVFETELQSFWDMPIVLDLGEVVRLG